MNFLKRLFAKQKIDFKCNFCHEEVRFSRKLVERLERRNGEDSVCPPKTECHYCHTGFVIPIHYKSKNGKTYAFNELAHKIKTLDPDSLLERLLDDNHS